MGIREDLNLKTNNKDLTISPAGLIGFILIIALIFFAAGWVFPVEGPIDYMYDDYVGNKTIQKPQIIAPAQPKKLQYGIDVPDIEDIKEVLIDLNEDGEQEWYLFLPLLKGNK